MRYQEVLLTENLYSYAGMVSSIHQSGEKGWAGPITKQGNARIRYIVVEAAYSHVRCSKESDLTRFFERKSFEKGTKKAIVATARKLLGIVYQMLKKERYITLIDPTAGTVMRLEKERRKLIAADQ